MPDPRQDSHIPGDGIKSIALDPMAGTGIKRMRYKTGNRGSIALFKTMAPYIAQSYIELMGLGSLTKAQCELLAKGVDLPGNPKPEAALAARMIQAENRACQMVEDDEFGFSGESFDAVYRALNGEKNDDPAPAQMLGEIADRVKDVFGRALYAFLLVLKLYPGDAAWELSGAVFMEACLASARYAPLMIPSRERDLFITRLNAFRRDGDASQILLLIRAITQRSEKLRQRMQKQTANGSFFPYFPD